MRYRFFIGLSLLLLVSSCRLNTKKDEIPPGLIQKLQGKTLLEYNKEVAERSYQQSKAYADSLFVNYFETGTGLLVDGVSDKHFVGPGKEEEVKISFDIKVLKTGFSFSGEERSKIKALSLNGFTEMAQLTSLGDSIEAIVPSHLGYGIRGKGQKIPPAADLYVKLRLLKIY